MELSKILYSNFRTLRKVEINKNSRHNKVTPAITNRFITFRYLCRTKKYRFVLKQINQCNLQLCWIAFCINGARGKVIIVKQIWYFGYIFFVY